MAEIEIGIVETALLDPAAVEIGMEDVGTRESAVAEPRTGEAGKFAVDTLKTTLLEGAGREKGEAEDRLGKIDPFKPARREGALKEILMAVILAAVTAAVESRFPADVVFEHSLRVVQESHPVNRKVGSLCCLILPAGLYWKGEDTG